MRSDNSEKSWAPRPDAESEDRHGDVRRKNGCARQGRKVEYRVDKTGVIHVGIGKVSFEADKLRENIQTLTDAVVKAKPSTAKGKYVKKVNLAATMGPGVLLDETAYVK